MHRAGLETMLMNYYRNIDREVLQFDFLTHRPEKSDYDDEILSLGGKVYYAPRLYPQNYPAYFRWMKDFWAQHPEYTVVHSHIDAMSYLPLLTAKRAGVPVRIAHSHSTSIDKDFKYIPKQFFRGQITKAANVYWACGEEAGRFLFGDTPFREIPNAVDAEKFAFSSELCAQKRGELGVNDAFVVGHVARLAHEKNQCFLLDIFREIKQEKENAVLLLIGVGERERAIRKKAEQLGLTDSVRFLGRRSDVNELYQAMDVFVLPSLFEGVPLTGIEAQFAGLPCFFSDAVTREVDFSHRSQFLSLQSPPSAWAKEICHTDGVRYNCIEEVPYHVKNAAPRLQEMYLAFAETCRK